MSNTANHDLNDRSPVTVLVVDDEPYIRDLVLRWLSSEGYSCAEAEDANAAWTYLQKNDVHLVTLDINLPGRTGIELLPQIKESFPDIEVIMLTARGETDTAIEALTHGAYGYLIKPVEREELLMQVRNGLQRRHMILEKRAYTQNLEERVHEQTQTIRRAHEETIHRLVSASHYRDEETGAHIKRTGLYCEVFAAAAGWAHAEVERVRFAAPMHDVGKIGIPDAILRKPGKLTPEEYELMKTHAKIGARILWGSESPMLQMAHEIALCHHERWDGMGYPAGLAGAEIPECARIMAITDVYDALIHDRVYRPAFPEDRVVTILKNGRGTHFDPYLLELFLDLLPEMRQIRIDNPDDATQPPFSDQVLAPSSWEEGIPTTL